MPLHFALYLAALALLPLAAHASPHSSAPGAGPPTSASAPTPKKRASARPHKPRIVHLPSPSEESPRQRDRRLKRECRGLPNAGACLGYALSGR